MKKLNLNVSVDFDGNTLYIAEDSSSGCKYNIADKKQLLFEICNYFADIIDENNEYIIEVKDKNA